VRFRLFSRVGAVVLAAGLVLVAAAPAHAAAPTNDTFGGAVPIGSVPFTTSADTSQATTDADDANANAICGAPAMDASVWYSITPATDGGLVADVSRSSYTAGVLVVTGAPGAFEIVACGPDVVGFQAVAGTTYYLLIIDDQYDGTGNGGTLVLNVDKAPPPPTMNATVDPTAGFNSQTGSATVHGTVNCGGVVDFAFLQVELHQQVGRGEVVGGSFTEVACDGADHPWSVEIFPAFGRKFAGGKGAAVSFAVACGPFDCALDFKQRTVQLSRRG
jgi:hypothetical protein